MSLDLVSKNDRGGIVLGLSNGEWAAITSLAAAFGVLGKPWSGDNGSRDEYTPRQLEEIAQRCEQVGKTAKHLRTLARSGGARLK